MPHNRIRPTVAVLLGLLLIASIGPRLWQEDAAQNLYALQAEALLAGRLDLPHYLHDAAVVDGRYLVPFPPFPALLLLPIVAVVGAAHTKLTIVALLLALLNIRSLGRIFGHLDLDQTSASWLAAGFLFGTAYWQSHINGSYVWFFAHVVAVTLLLLAIDEALGGGRAGRVGWLLGLAFLTRQLSLFSAPFLLAVLCRREPQTRSSPWRQVIRFGLSLGSCGALYLAFNWARFGNPFDTGYAYLQHPGFLQERFARHGLFDLAYVPFNFAYLFLQGFHLSFDSPTRLGWPTIDLFGTAITFASPFLLAALWAPRRPWPTAAAWASVLLTIAPMLCYYNNGWKQVNGQRFSLDFLPVLCVLVALGARDLRNNQTASRLWRVAIVYAIGLNLLAFALALIES